MTKPVKKYISECRRTFPFISKNEKLFLKRLEENLNESDYSYDQICNEFGSPKDVMISYIENCDNEYILKRTSIKSLHKRFLLVLFCILIMISALTLYYNQLIYEEYQDSSIITEEITIEEEYRSK